jgi:phenylacetic acid degradation operon negative regulatory protein
MEPSVRDVITELLSVAADCGQPEVRVRLLIDACAIFGFSANTVRVTLVKMRAQGLVESPSRGLYQLGPERRALSEQVMSWRRMREELVPWDGSWIGAVTGHLSRADRAALGKRNRALRLLGFRELEEGLSLRPNNRAGGVAQMRAQLLRLGGEPGVVLCRADQLSADDVERAMQLWDSEAMLRRYGALTERLATSAAQRATLGIEQAMHEAFVLGREVIRWLALDPLLPERMVPQQARDALIDAMIRYDADGRWLWREYLGVIGNEYAA